MCQWRVTYLWCNPYNLQMKPWPLTPGEVEPQSHRPKKCQQVQFVLCTCASRKCRGIGWSMPVGMPHLSIKHVYWCLSGYSPLKTNTILFPKYNACLGPSVHQTGLKHFVSFVSVRSRKRLRSVSSGRRYLSVKSHASMVEPPQLSDNGVTSDPRYRKKVKHTNGVHKMKCKF